MSLLKVNACQDNSVEILRSNLIRDQVAFKQTGTAFLVDGLDAMLHPKIFDNLWIGFNANIELQDVSADDEAFFYSH